MKLARLFLAVLAAGTLAACSGDSVTEPEARPTGKPGQDLDCKVEVILVNGVTVVRCTGQMGSGG